MHLQQQKILLTCFSLVAKRKKQTHIMYNFYQRAYAVFTYSITVIGFVVGFLAVSSLWLHKKADIIETKISEMEVLRFSKLPASGNDRVYFSFNMEADLRPLYHWNVKQLFVYLTAEYDSPDHATSRITVWDKIITKKEKANLQLTQQVSKYGLVDEGNAFRGKTIRLRLHWNVVPFSGLLYNQDAAQEFNMTLPTRYDPKRSNEQPAYEEYVEMHY